VAFQLYRKAFTKIWYLILGIGFYSASMFVLYYKLNFESKIVTVVYYLTCSLINVLILTYLQAIILCRIYDTSIEQDRPFKTLIKYTNHKYLKLAASELIGLLAFYITLCASFVLFAIGYAIFTPHSKIHLGSIEIALIGSTALSLTMFILTLFVPTPALILFDNKGVWPALKESIKLVWSKWWHSFMVIFPFYLGYSAVFFIEISKTILPTWHMWIIIFIVNISFNPWTLLTTLVLYNDLKSRKNTNNGNSGL